MSLLLHHKAANMKVYDINPLIQLRHLRPAFQKLQDDPYVSDGRLKRNILWLRHVVKDPDGTALAAVPGVAERTFARMNKATLEHVVDCDHAPCREDSDLCSELRVHEYPEIDVAVNPYAIRRIAGIFAEAANLRDNAPVLMQFHRQVFLPHADGAQQHAKRASPCADGWIKVPLSGPGSTVGILCVDRNNVAGDRFEFKNATKAGNSNIPQVSFEMVPGYMVIFQGAHYRLPNHGILDNDSSGYRDLVLLSC